MMKRALLVSLLFLAGCVVQSVGPFCTDNSMVYVREVIGEWTLQKDFGDDVSTNAIRAWVFSGDAATNCTLKAFDKQNVGATFAVRFFKLGKNMFVDVLPGEPGDETKMNSYWTWTVRAVHTVCKVELNGDALALKPLDYDWLKKNLEKHKLSLPHMNDPDGVVLFTASPRQWEAFLSKHAADTGAFVEEHAYVLKRNKSTKS